MENKTPDEKDDKFESLKKEVKILSEKIDLLIETCSNMDAHISFVNGVYNTVRTPFSYILGKFNLLTGNRVHLPETYEKARLEYKNDETTFSGGGTTDIS